VRKSRYLGHERSVRIPHLASPVPHIQQRIGAVGNTYSLNRDAPPFDNADMRRAIALGLDRKAFIDIISEGQGDIGGVMQPLPEGVWGMPQDVLQTLPGYDPDAQKNRVAAISEELRSWASRERK
jgi:ABC-type transport system substrate-binding protein